MAVKRRRSKRLLSPMEEMEKWSMLFQSGNDYLDELDDLLDPTRPPDVTSGVLDDLPSSEREAIVKDAWMRLGSIYLESAEYERRSREDPAWSPWALRKYGPPG